MIITKIKSRIKSPRFRIYLLRSLEKTVLQFLIKRLNLSEKWKYVLEHWKLGIHLVLHTNRFGVNNDWWFQYRESLFGYRPWWRTLLNIVTIKPMIRNYKAMKHRAIYLGFMHPDEVRILWGKHPWFDD